MDTTLEAASEEFVAVKKAVGKLTRHEKALLTVELVQELAALSIDEDTIPNPYGRDDPRGIWAHLPEIDEDELAQLRSAMWKNFPRDIKI